MSNVCRADLGVAWFFVGVLVCMSIPVAAASGADDCTLIPKLMGVDRYGYDGVEQKYGYFYSRYCEGTEVRSDINMDSAAEAVINYIPVKGRLGFGSAKEKLRHICRTQGSEDWSLSQQSTAEQTVVREAIDAYNQCLSMQNTRLSLASKDASTFSIGLQLRSTRIPVQFSGLEIGGPGKDAVECSAPPQPDSMKKSVKISGNTRVALADTLWTITCHRRMQKKPGSDEGFYPKITVQVNTSDRSLSLALPASTYFGPETAEEMKQLVDGLQARYMADLKKIRSVRFYQASVTRGDNGYRGRRTSDPVSVVADVCALIGVSHAFWPKPEYSSLHDCGISYEAEKHVWTLTAIGEDSTAETCRMVCTGVIDPQ